jgi:flavin-dependent dehydrogenase
MTSYDAIVVGGGPAGSATAILLAERGWSVLLLDKAAFPRPKICGEYLSPESARILDRLGVLKGVDAVAQPVVGMRIVAPDGRRLEGRYPARGPWPGYRGHGLAISREVLDRLLFDRARVLPLDARDRHRVTDLRRADGAVVGAHRSSRAPSASCGRIVSGAWRSSST